MKTDRKILIGIGAALSAALCAVLFTGCGSTEAKLGRMAETYIRKKYGFSVKATQSTTTTSTTISTPCILSPARPLYSGSPRIKR